MDVANTTLEVTQSSGARYLSLIGDGEHYAPPIRVDSALVGMLAREPGDLLTDNSGLAVAAGQLDLWNKIVKRAKRLDGLEIDFACEHLPSGRKLTSLIWNANTNSGTDIAPSQSPLWQFSYTVPRGGDVETRICASGRAPRGVGFI